VLEALRRRASRYGLDVVLVSEWDGPGAAQEARRYCQMWGIEATVLNDEAAAYARRLGVRGVPTNVLVDAGGIVREVGASTTPTLLAAACRLCPELSAVRDELLAYGQDPAGFAGG
jgi:hypothetical protein